MRRLAVISYHSSPLVEPGLGDAGGMTVYVRSVSQALSKLGFRTDIFTRSDNGTLTTTDIFPGVRVVGVPTGPPRALDKLELTGHIDEFVSGIRAFATSTRSVYDAIHSHYWQSGVAAADLAASWGVPLVHSNHTLAKVKNRHLPPGDPPEPDARLRGEERVIAAAETLIASTDDEWEHLACLYGANHDRIKTIYPGVDHGLFSPADSATARRALGLGDGPVLAYVGRIQPLKGLDLALRAVEQLEPALGEQVTLLVVGGASGPAGEREETALRALASSLRIADSVRLEGPKPHASTPVFYRAADAVVVCSYSESFGLSALEAQACGTPVVGTAVGGLKHIVADGRTGFLCDSRDPSEFAGRLKTLLGDHELARALSANAVEAASSFTWERTASELADLYECLVTQRMPEACTC